MSRSVDAPAEDASVNVMGLLNVLESACAAGTRKVVFAGSGGTLYGEPRQVPVKESARRSARPQSPYGISKALALEYLWFYRSLRGLDYTALALANVYGLRQDPNGEAGVVAIFGSLMLRGESPSIFGDGNQTRDFVYVDDAVHAFALAADRGSGGLYNVGTGLETSVSRIYQLIAEITGFRREPRFGPPREGDVRRCALDSGLAERELGWKPWTTLEQGLPLTVDWLRSA